MSEYQIETARLRLRPATEADIDALHKIWIHPNVREFLWDDVIISREKAEEVVQEGIKSFAANGYGLWCIEEIAGGKVIGFCGLGNYGGQPEVEILYGLHPNYWGLGFATEAADAVLKYGFEKRHLPVILVGVDPPNLASVRVVNKLGMTFNKRVQVNNMLGEPIEVLYYGIDRERFQAEKRAGQKGDA